jgi:hypothetical protein
LCYRKRQCAEEEYQEIEAISKRTHGGFSLVFQVEGCPLSLCIFWILGIQGEFQEIGLCTLRPVNGKQETANLQTAHIWRQLQGCRKSNAILHPATEPVKNYL